MKMDLKVKIFSKKHYWVSLRQRPVEFTPDLPKKRCPNLTICTLSPTKLHQNWKIPDHFHLRSSFFYAKNIKCFFSFLFIFLSLDAQKRLSFMVLMKKPLGKQISKTNWWCVNASFKRNWILISSLQGQMYHQWGGSPTVSNKMIRKGFLAAFQVVSVYVVFEILHRWHTWGVLAAYWRWQYAMLADDTGMPSSRGSL